MSWKPDIEFFLKPQNPQQLNTPVLKPVIIKKTAGEMGCDDPWNNCLVTACIMTTFEKVHDFGVIYKWWPSKDGEPDKSYACITKTSLSSANSKLSVGMYQLVVDAVDYGATPRQHAYQFNAPFEVVDRDVDPPTISPAEKRIVDMYEEDEIET